MNSESSSKATKPGRLEREQAAQLESRIRGYLIHPDDDTYDEARAVWNGMIDRRPALIARCAAAADVITAVNFAREHAVAASVRGGGHNVAGNALCDKGLVIDLSDMRSVRVDPYRQTVRTEAGVRLGDLDRETQAFGLVVPSGIVTETGIAGLTLGGGLGWLSRAWGLTCDNLLSADVVTADGRLLHVSDDENPDLFWALRGGGGNFGIVTSFEFCCYEFGPTALAGIVMHPLERAPELLRFYREYTSSVPDEVTAFALLRRAPPAPFVPEEFHGAPVCAIGACYAGLPEKGEALISPIKVWGELIADVLAPKSFLAHQSTFDAGQPAGARYYWKSHYFDALDDEMLDTIARQGEVITSPLSILALVHLGGAVARVGEQETAYPNRGSPYVMNVNGSCKNPVDDDANIAWVRETWDAMKAHSTGARYLNFEAEDGVQSTYGAEKYERLAAVKAKYDPENFFRFNQNIKPAVAGGRAV